MERHRSDAVRYPLIAGAEALGGILRLRRIRGIGRRNYGRGECAPDRAARGRSRAAMRGNDRAGVARHRRAETAAVHPAFGVERTRDRAEGRSTSVRATDDSSHGGLARTSALTFAAGALPNGWILVIGGCGQALRRASGAPRE